MALLSSMMRTAAVTGRTDFVSAWFGGRQGGRWAEQTVRAAMPTARGTPPRAREPAETLRALADLHRRGVVDDAEFERLRTGLREGRS